MRMLDGIAGAVNTLLGHLKDSGAKSLVMSGKDEKDTPTFAVWLAEGSREAADLLAANADVQAAWDAAADDKPAPVGRIESARRTLESVWLALNECDPDGIDDFDRLFERVRLEVINLGGFTEPKREE